jgi:hypothetical protein
MEASDTMEALEAMESVIKLRQSPPGSYYNHDAIYQKEYDAAFAVLVPIYGEASDDHGELLRLFSRMYSRYYNDGDMPTAFWEEFKTSYRFRDARYLPIIDDFVGQFAFDRADVTDVADVAWTVPDVLVMPEPIQSIKNFVECKLEHVMDVVTFYVFHAKRLQRLPTLPAVLDVVDFKRLLDGVAVGVVEELEGVKVAANPSKRSNRSKRSRRSA